MSYTAPNGAVFEKKPARYSEHLYKLRLKISERAEKGGMT
jgi:hypothetical protein